MAHIKTKYFPIFLFISAFVVEASAVFFSVYGLTALFSGAALSIGIMAGSLEFAKVVSVSYLYRYWKQIALLFKGYMTSAVLILMMITSLGIYGFLSNAFQGSTLLLEKDIAKLTLQEDEIARIKDDNSILKTEKVELQKNQSSELSALTIRDATRYSDVSRRASVQKRYQTLIKEKDDQITSNNKKIESLSQSITDAKVKMIDTGADVGPIIFVAKAFNLDINTVVQYLILLFIIVFDPLALALIIAFNKLTIEKDEVPVKEKDPRLNFNLSPPSRRISREMQKAFDDVFKRNTTKEESLIPTEIVNSNSEVNKINDEIIEPTTPTISDETQSQFGLGESTVEPIVKPTVQDIPKVLSKIPEQDYEDEGRVYVDTEKENKALPHPIQTSTF